MHHLACFYGSVAASQTDLTINPVTDGYLTIGTSGLLLPDTMRIVKAYVGGLGLTQARINVPSLRAISQPRIHPINAALYPVDDAPIQVYGDRGPRIMRSEGVTLAVTTDATAGPNFQHGFLWLASANVAAPFGDITTIRATTTVTQVAGAWSPGNITLEQDLPAGSYAVVGLDAVGAATQAIRLRFPGATLAPGVLCQQAAGQFFLNTFRYGASGQFGVFENSLPPTIELIGAAGAATVAIFLDLIKVR